MKTASAVTCITLFKKHSGLLHQYNVQELEYKKREPDYNGKPEGQHILGEEKSVFCRHVQFEMLPGLPKWRRQCEEFGVQGRCVGRRQKFRNYGHTDFFRDGI